MTEDERDAHLQKALRHAPDATVAPPPELSARILKEARAQAGDAQPSTPPARHSWATWWRRLTHPALATSLAGVMVATLVGLMWWDQPMDEARFRAPAADILQAPAPAATPAPPPAASVQAAPARPSTPSPQRSEASRPRAPAVTPPRGEDTRAARTKESEQRAKKAEAPAVRAGQTAPDARPEARDPPTGAQHPASPPPPAPRAVPAPPAALPASASSEPAPMSTSSPGADTSPHGGPSDAHTTFGASSTPRASDPARLRSIAPATAPQFASVRHAIAADPSPWTWQRGSGAERDMNEALQTWLAQLDAAVGTTWRPRAALESSSPRGRELRLLREGRALHSLRLTERGVLWDNEQATWEAELPTDTLTALQAALDNVTP